MFTRNFKLGITSSFLVRIPILSRGRLPLLSLNELRKMYVKIILGKFVNKSHNQALIGL